MQFLPVPHLSPPHLMFNTSTSSAVPVVPSLVATIIPLATITIAVWYHRVALAIHMVSSCIIRSRWAGRHRALSSFASLFFVRFVFPFFAQM